MFQEERMIAFSNDVERCSERGRKVSVGFGGW